MENSYVHNPLVTAIEYELIHRGPQYVVWAGDYADPSINIQTKAGKKSYTYYEYTSLNGFKIEYSENTLKHIDAVKEIEDTFTLYLVNLTKKEFIEIPKYNPEKLTIHPLPILTSDGNGRGGGDYSGTNYLYAGRWCGDLISIVKDKPSNAIDLGITFIEE